MADVHPQPISMSDPAVRVAIRDAVWTITDICHRLAKQAGWWDRPDARELHATLVRIGLEHSELSEAFEAARKNKMDDHLPHRRGLEVELADCLIRIADQAGGEELDLAGAVMEKLAYNQQRADHKPENRAKEGGKKW